LSSNFRSTFLFAKPDWYEGVARLVDFANAMTEYNTTATPGGADTRALAQDWLAVGDELRQALAYADK
jgi:hypothetical protein